MKNKEAALLGPTPEVAKEKIS